ncbi:hemerythrin domain-containing protein [Streptomyces sp. NPDC058220]|uniref:hemerythrin domain-containing protein n=1 Tax=Streptomyces sp. NPDC058220 TaxID=3346387 RepID=UPI0036E81512
MYEELLAVHTVMRRGAALVCESFARLVDGEPVDARALVATSRWLIEFVHRHHAGEDVLFWPVLRDLFPDSVAEIDELTIEHQALDAELHALARALDAIATPEGVGPHPASLVIVGQAALYGLPSAQRVQAILIKQFDEEEPVLLELFPRVPDRDILRLRKSIVQGVTRTSPHLVLGLLEDPDRTPAYAEMVSHFPAALRWTRPVLLARYRSIKKALGVSAPTRL